MFEISSKKHNTFVLQTWAERFIKFGKERKEDKASVEEFTIAKFLYEAHFPEEKKRLVKINKCLAKCYFKLNDSKETIIHLDACLKMEPNFYKVSFIHTCYLDIIYTQL